MSRSSVGISIELLQATRDAQVNGVEAMVAYEHTTSLGNARNVVHAVLQLRQIAPLLREQGVHNSPLPLNDWLEPFGSSLWQLMGE
jgi:hypothetical protein